MMCMMYFCVQCRLIKGSLEVKLPTIWTDEKAEVGRVREEKKKEDQRRERVRGKKMQVREQVEKSRNTVFFQQTDRQTGRHRQTYIHMVHCFEHLSYAHADSGFHLGGVFF